MSVLTQDICLTYIYPWMRYLTNLSVLGAILGEILNVSVFYSNSQSLIVAFYFWYNVEVLGILNKGYICVGFFFR